MPFLVFTALYLYSYARAFKRRSNPVHFRAERNKRQAVPTFLEGLGGRYQGLYNDSGRGLPDIAALSVNLPILFNNREEGKSGTSGATPIVAGIISLLNDQLISTGRRPLGLLNPWLYGRGLAALNNITEGSNSGCDMDGFSAIAGWDPVRSTRVDTCLLSMLDDLGLRR
ncbi:tripeptidyl-peptidase [Lactarius sanguifluus]|nr:tripeptidyl-peptidase [Lactarius sanguifluus]